MRYQISTPEPKDSYPICLLVPQINADEIAKAYFKDNGLDPDDVLILDLHHSGKKTPKKEIVAYIEEELTPVLIDYNVEYLVVADSEYFKAFTKAAKVEANLGYVMDSVFGSQKVVYVPNYRQIFYDPEKINAKIQQGLDALNSHRVGNHIAPGTGIIKHAEYPDTYEGIKRALRGLLESNDDLSIDIEGFALRHTETGIGTITFCWNQHEGIAFPVDCKPIKEATEAPFIENVRNEPVRNLLRWFFIEFAKQTHRKAVYHSIGFDVTVLIYQLFMKDILDTEGLLNGMDIMLANWDCTKLITYLATNSCAGNRLGLKEQSQEYSGNYSMGEDINDITKIPLPKLLEYNLIDGLSTHYVRNKHWPTLLADQQEDIYINLFKPSMLDIIQMQLTGMPVNMERVLEVEEILNKDLNDAVERMRQTKVVQQFTYRMREKIVEKKNAEYKKKRITVADVTDEFNPNSGPQLQDLLFNMLGLPIINYTKSKQPSTDGETIAALLNHTKDPDVLEFLEALQLFNIVAVLTTNFMPSLKGSVKGPDGWHYLFGSFNLGGTLSGRLSSSGPNLQNLPSTGKGNPLKLKYAKLIKSCFQAPPGWLFCGIDFASLEDRISALTTKDPNKLKVYTDGYDGHSLRAFAYFGNDMPDIDPNSVDSINAIAKKYKPLRDRSKNPTFTLTYQGTHHALVKKYAFSLEQAKEIEEKYHELYKVSDDWVNAQLDRAMTDGYITAAFGLRLRTPLLKQVIRNTSKTPHEAQAEGRTAGNALGQSWCLLNSRAGNEFNSLVRRSVYRLDIRPCAQIHDAQYHLIRDDIGAIMFTNEHLVKAVQWQEHPDIAHDQVKLGGEFSIFYPTWNNEIGIPNGASEDEIFEIIAKAMN